MKYVVTGAAGFIGSQLAEALLAAGHEVVGVDCFTDYYDVREKEENARRLDVMRLDLAADELDLDGVDGVFHLAGQPGVRSSFDDRDVYIRRNVLATERVLRQSPVRVVFASSSSVYGDAEAYPTSEETPPRPISPYGVTKLECEALIRVSGVEAVVLRYFTVYGPRQRPDMFMRRACDALLAGETLEIYGSGEQSRSFTYVGDAVEATIAAMERAAPGTVYNVGGGEEASVNAAVAELERVSGSSLDRRHLDTARGDVKRTKADITRIEADLGWRPETSLSDGLTRMWEWASARVAAR